MSIQGHGHFLNLTKIHLQNKIKTLFFQSALPIKNNVYLEPLLEERTKFCINDPGHMIKNVATPIYGIDLSKPSSQQSVDRFQGNLVCCIWDSGTPWFV